MLNEPRCGYCSCQLSLPFFPSQRSGKRFAERVEDDRPACDHDPFCVALALYGMTIWKILCMGVSCRCGPGQTWIEIYLLNGEVLRESMSARGIPTFLCRSLI